MFDEDEFLTQEREWEQKLLKESVLAPAIQRLQENSDFKLVFDEWYFTHNVNEALKGAGNINLSEEKRSQFVDKLKAVGFLQNYLKDMLSTSIIAKNSLEKLIASKHETNLGN